MTTPDVLVVGGGPGGLTLARVLQRGGVGVTVLERDPSPATRVRGGPLDLHGDSGQIAARVAGVHEAWRALARSDDEWMTLLGSDGATLVTMPPSPDGEGNPEIDRTQLRDLLLDSLAPGTVTWGVTVEEVATGPDGRPTVRAADGSARSADLVVGADGAWSRVRPLLSAATPAYSGVTFVEFTVPEVGDELATTFGRGTTMAQGPYRSLGGQRLSDGSLWAHAGFRVPEDWGDGFPTDPDEARALLRSSFPDWSPRVLGLIDAGEGPFTVRRIRALPIGHTWPSTPGLTLLGDAAHLMSPFGGNGANLAMRDAADLGTAIVEHPDDLAGAVAGYEASMQARATIAAQEAGDGIATALAADSPAGTLAFFARMGLLDESSA